MKAQPSAGDSIFKCPFPNEVHSEVWPQTNNGSSMSNKWDHRKRKLALKLVGYGSLLLLIRSTMCLCMWERRQKLSLEAVQQRFTKAKANSMWLNLVIAVEWIAQLICWSTIVRMMEDRNPIFQYRKSNGKFELMIFLEIEKQTCLQQYSLRARNFYMA